MHIYFISLLKHEKRLNVDLEYTISPSSIIVQCNIFPLYCNISNAFLILTCNKIIFAYTGTLER